MERTDKKSRKKRTKLRNNDYLQNQFCFFVVDNSKKSNCTDLKFLLNTYTKQLLDVIKFLKYSDSK